MAAKKLVIDANRWDHHNMHQRKRRSCQSDNCSECQEEDKCFESKNRHCCHVDVLKFERRLGANSDEFEVMNDYLNSIGLSLQILDRESRQDPIWSGIRSSDSDQTIHIDRHEDHYNFIRSMPAYLNRKYYCDNCRTPHDNITHRCAGSCWFCGNTMGVCEETERVQCNACENTFRSLECYNYHLLEGTPRHCQKMGTCRDCGLTYRFTNVAKERHVCFERKCLSCKEKYTTTPHICMVKPADKSKWIEEDKSNKIIVCFDIESALIKTSENVNKHFANLLVADIVCEDCYDHNIRAKLCQNTCQEPNCKHCSIGDADICKVCHRGHFKFEGEDCVAEFGDYLYKDLAKRAEEMKCQIIVFAHNFKGYDSHFIFSDLFTRQFKDQPQIIMQGTKIMKLTIGNISFIDTLCLFLMPLAALPKTFGFEEDVKGFFPHLFNQPENWSYSGPIPEIEYFDTDNMKPKSAAACEKWLSEMPVDRIWNFRNEIIKYCNNDVKILTKSIMEFRKQFQNITGLDPITRRFTIAGVAKEHFMADFLSEGTLCVTPTNGFIPNRNASMSSNIWLDYQQSVVMRETIYREQKVGPYFVDGFIPETKTVFEFLGCFWHGCDKCHTGNRDKKQYYGQSFNQKYLSYQTRVDWFAKYGYNYREIWEHDFHEELRTNEELDHIYSVKFAYYKGIEEVKNIDIRDAFFGGRVEPFELHYEFDNDECGQYYDVTSLYPYVMSRKSYGTGIPKIISEINSTSIDNYFGFVKCKILAPEQLYIPILPVRYEKKLYFPLCVKCIEEKNAENRDLADKNCPHNDHERAFIGTWFSEELKLAVSKGYRIQHIYQVLQYDQQSNEVFKGYINAHLAEKVKASENNFNDDQSRVKFCDEYRQREGIDLQPEDLVPNPGKRAIAKLMLNSLWGKFAQKPNLQQTAVCQTYEQFRKILGDAKYKIKGIEQIDEDNILVNYKFVDDQYDKPGHRNISIAAMVTAYGRMKLYEIMDQIEASHPQRMLYCDTDSVIFKHDPTKDWITPDLGDYLGQMTDELAKDYGIGAKMVSFSSGGPKNYGYQVKDSSGNYHQQVKVKGINLTSAAVDKLTYGRLKGHAVRYQMAGIMNKPTNDAMIDKIPQIQFQSDAKQNVSSRKFDKNYRVVYSKRLILGRRNLPTIPYGYKLSID